MNAINRDDQQPTSGAPKPGTDVLLGGEFVRIVMVSNWTTHAPRTTAAVIIRREDGSHGTLYVTEQEHGDYLYTGGAYDLTARQAARDFDSRARSLDVGD